MIAKNLLLPLFLLLNLLHLGSFFSFICYPFCAFTGVGSVMASSFVCLKSGRDIWSVHIHSNQIRVSS